MTPNSLTEPRDSLTDPGEALHSRTRLLRAAGWASVIIAVLLLLIKLAAWWMTGSASVLASLTDSLLDLVSSSLNLIALRYATRPADDRHRFGRGKAEALGAFAQSILLSLSSLGIVIYAAGRLLDGSAVTAEAIPLGEALMLAVLVLTGILVAFQSYVIRRTHSALINADSLHYRSDFLINASVLIALNFSAQLPWLDGVLAMLIAAYVAKSAHSIFSEATHELLDRELPQDIDDQVLSIACGHYHVFDVHNLKTRRSGGIIFVQMDIEVDGDMSLAAAHAVSKTVKDNVLERFPQAEVLIHIDPVETVKLRLAS